MLSIFVHTHEANLLICEGLKDGCDIERFHEPLLEMDSAGENTGEWKTERFVRRGVKGKERERKSRESIKT